MTELVARIERARITGIVRAHLYVARMVAVGLIAIGVSGAVCQVVGYSLGDHALAADSQVAQPSAERCAEYMEYAPGKATCAAAEMAHHADETVRNRVAVGILGLIAVAGYVLFRMRSAYDVRESAAQTHAYLLMATAAFGIAAAVLLGTGIGVALGSGDAAPRWFTDGGVAAAFFAAHALWLWATHRKAIPA